MRRGILVFIVLCMFFSSCTLKDKTVPAMSQQESVKTSITENKEYPKTLRLALSNAGTLNPYTQDSTENLEALSLIYEPLFAYDENMRAVEVLAKDLTVSQDTGAVTVRLKDNALWHDGKELVANDVLYTVSLLLSQPTAYSDTAISRAEMMDRKTVRISFKKPQMNAKEQLMFPIVRSDGAEIIGTGPFKLVGKESSDLYSFSVFEGYHAKRPVIENIKMINSPGPESAVRLFDIGETDILTPGLFDYKSFSIGAKARLYDYPVNTFVYLGLNFDNSVLWGESSRQALMYVLDKNEIVDKALYKKATVSDFPINPASWVYPRELEYKKDTAYAEKLLLKDSWTRTRGVFARMIDGIRQDFKLRLLVLDDEELKSVAENIEKSFDNFGIDCVVEVKAYNEFIESIKNKSYDIFIDRAKLQGSADFELLTGAGNVFGYLNSELNSVVERIKAESDDNLLELYRRCCEIFLKDVQFIPLFFYKEAVVTNANISDNLIVGMNNPFYNIYDWNG